MDHINQKVISNNDQIFLQNCQLELFGLHISIYIFSSIQLTFINRYILPKQIYSFDAEYIILFIQHPLKMPPNLESITTSWQYDNLGDEKGELFHSISH